MNEKKNPRIAIIGAGLGGLCLAQGLKKRGVSSAVFEKDGSINSRKQGYRIRINEDGRNALCECLSEELYTAFIKTCAQSTEGINIVNTRLENIYTPIVETWSDGLNGSPDLKPNRLTLREILMNGIESSIEYGKIYERYEYLPSGEIRIFFQDGSFFICDLLIAADGVNSQIGQTIFNDEKIDTGIINIYGRTFYSDKSLKETADIFKSGTTVITEKQFSLIADAMVFDKQSIDIYPTKLSPLKNYFYWAFIGKPAFFEIDPKQLYELSTFEILSKINKVSKNWHSGLSSLFQNCDVTSLSVSGVRTSKPKDFTRLPLHKNITALGDALHTMSPAGGMGANTAFKDAALLSNLIGAEMAVGNDFDKAVRNYEKQMIAYSNEAIIQSGKAGERLYGCD